MLSKINFSVFGRRVNLLAKIAKDRTEWVAGIGNRTEDGQYIVFLDYDGVPLDYIEDEIKFLQDNYYLSSAYIFFTGNGYHVIFLEKMSIGELLRIMDSSTCDKDYREVPLLNNRRIWVLRQTRKKNNGIKYLKEIRGVEYYRKRSKAHSLYLISRYGIKIDIKRNNFDKSETLVTASYYIKGE